jgi:hypothetical protein
MTDERKILKDLLFALYSENVIQCRHHETQRATVTSSIIAIDTIIIGLITFDKAINRLDIPLSVLLILLGIFGATFTLKHYERYSLCVERLRQYRQELDKQFGDNEILRLKNIADELHQKRFPNLVRYTHHKFWIFLHLIITAIAITLTLISIFNPT